MTIDENKKTGHQANGKTGAAEPKGGTPSMKYSGPDYGSAIVLPSRGKCDPRSWDAKRIKKELEDRPGLARYFKKA